jgi:hypothetical protein
VKALVTLFGTDGMPAQPVLAGEGEYHSVTVKSKYLVSAGQRQIIGLVIHDPDKVTYNSLVDGRAVAGVVIPKVWDQSYIPTTRPFQDVLRDATDHGWEQPTHGADCVCMDTLICELAIQMSKAIPPDTGSPEDVHLRLLAKRRVSYILQALVRKL